MPQKPELDVLIACASPSADPGLIPRLRSSLATPMDWPELFSFAAASAERHHDIIETVRLAGKYLA